MPEQRHLVDELFNAIPPDERGNFLINAGIYSIAPSSLLALEMWRESNRPRLTAALLRRFNFSDEQVIRAFSEGDLRVDSRPEVADIVIRFSELSLTTSSPGRLLLTDVAVASGVTLELFRDVVAALQPLGVAADPPSTAVASGSGVTFTIAAAPVAAGVALVLSCLPGVPTDVALGVGGAITASTGIIDLALNWVERIAEVRRKNSEAYKLRAEGAKLLAEALKFETEAKRLRTEAESIGGQPVVGIGSEAVSALVQPALVHAAAERLGLGDALANHLLNRALPTAIDARNYVRDIVIVSGKAAGA